MAGVRSLRQNLKQNCPFGGVHNWVKFWAAHCASQHTQVKLKPPYTLDFACILQSQTGLLKICFAFALFWLQLRRYKKLRTIIMIRFPLLFLVFFTLPSVAGQLYKWVDENGRTQYSQFPPEDGQSETMNIRNAPSSSNAQASKDKLKAMRQQLLEQSVDRNTQSEEEKQDAERAAIMAENCKNAQQNLRNIHSTHFIFLFFEAF